MSLPLMSKSVVIISATSPPLCKYNEIILVNSVGTLRLRAGKTFRASRKIGKHHQNILVFLKGDAKKAVEYLGDVEIAEYEEVEEEL